VAINAGKVIAGGLVAGVVMNVIDMGLAYFTLDLMRTELDTLNPTLWPGLEGSNAVVGFIVIDFVLAFLSVFTYAAIRPRFGPGPATAVMAAVLVWLVSASTWAFLTVMGIFSTTFFLISAAGALVNFIVSTSVGARIYTET
jgi:hypothetical protein